MSLTLRHLRCFRGGKEVLKGVHLDLKPGQGRVLAGPNGSGKSTLLGAVAGLLPCEGSIVWGGESVEDLPQSARVARGMGWLPQGPSIFRGLSVEQNLMAAAELHLPKDIRAARVEEGLAQFRLVPLRRQSAATLSGGERRRTELARLWILKPRLLLLDEPFAGLDEQSCHIVVERLAAWLAEGGITLVAEHQLERLTPVLPRILYLEEGLITPGGWASLKVAPPT